MENNEKNIGWSKDKAEKSKQELLTELKKEYGISDDNLTWVDKMLTEIIQEQEDNLNKKK